MNNAKYIFSLLIVFMVYCVNSELNAQWTSMGFNSKLVDTAIWDLNVHPTKPDTILVGTNTGLWITTNGGSNLAKSNIGLSVTPTVGIIRICRAPSNYNIVYLVTDNSDFQTNQSGGVYKSTNGGVSWTRLSDFQGMAIYGLTIHPTNSNWLFVSVNSQNYGGIWKSENGGSSFTQKFEKTSGGFVATIIYDTANPEHLVGGSNNGYTYVSNNGGEYWYEYDTSSLFEDKGTWEMEIKQDDGDYVLAGGAYYGMKRSSDGGYNWYSSGLSSVKIAGLKRDPDDADKVFCGTNEGDLYVTDDFGSSWTRDNGNLPTVNSIGNFAWDELSNRKMYIAVYQSDNAANVYYRSYEYPEAPQLAVTPTSLSYGSTSTTNTLYISNDGTGTLTWSIYDDQSWITLSPITGSTTTETDQVTVTVNRNGLAPSINYGTITINSNAGTAYISVSMTVASEEPELSVNPTLLAFGENETSLSFDITNTGFSTLTWNIYDDQSWITVSPISGSTTTETDQVTVTVNRSGLNPADYSGTITINSNDGTAYISVSMTVAGEPELSVNPTLLAFGESETSLNFDITNTGTGTLTWSVSDSRNWISVSPTSGSTTTETDQVTVTVDRSGLDPGDYYGTVTVSSNAGDAIVSVSMEVADTPQLFVRPTSLSFGESTVSQTLSITNIGTGTLSWELGDNQLWISLTPTTGTTTTETDEITVTVDRSILTPGQFNGTITITSNGGTQSVPVSVTVPSVPILSVTPDSLLFENSETMKQLYVENTGSGTLTWNAAKDQGWFTISPISGTTTTETDTMIVTVNRNGLSDGDYNGTVTITSNDGDFAVTVLMTVTSPPMLSVSVDSLLFGSSATSRDFAIQNTGGGILNWSITDDQSWITAQPSSGTTESETDQVTVSVDRAGLTAGNYSGTVTITSDGGDAEIAVTMSVAAEPVFSVSPGSFSFGNSEVSGYLVIRNSGSGTLSWALSEDEEWLSAVPTSGTTTTEKDTVIVTVTRTGMNAGNYSGSISITSNGGDTDVAVSMSVSMAPIANFTADITSGEAPLTVAFTDQSSGDISNWYWSFPGGNPDNASSEGPQTVVYQMPGRYSVTLTVVGSGGSDTEYRADYITVNSSGSPVIIHPQQHTVVEGNALPLETVVTDPDGVDEVYLFYCMGGARAYDSTAMNAQGSNIYDSEIPVSAITERGLQYYIKAIDNFGNVSYDPADGGYYVVQVQMTNLACSEVIPAKSYRMISVPLVLDDGSAGSVLIDDFGPYDKKKWRLFRYQDGSYVEYTAGNIESFAAGRGFWLISSEEKELDAGSGKSVSTLNNCSITLEPGWNMIANPFSFPVSWSDVIKNGNIENPWGYSGSSNTSSGFEANQTQLTPWQGYAIKNLDNVNRTIEIPPLEASTTLLAKSSTQLSEGEWILQLKVNCNNYVDRDNYLGCLQNSIDSWDNRDFSEPPVIGDYVSLYFPHPEWTQFPGDYSGDFRIVSEHGSRWQFVIETNLAESPVTLQCDNLEKLPLNWDVQLLDKTAGESHDLHRQSQYVYYSGDGVDRREFEIIVGESGYIDDNQLETAAGINLLQNFPDPFNTATVIKYSLPQQSLITLTIYNLLGEEINRLVDGKSMTSGNYEITWNGTNHKNEIVPSGVYFYCLKINSLQLYRKILYLK